jgi:hypothetical protein
MAFVYRSAYPAPVEVAAVAATSLQEEKINKSTKKFAFFFSTRSFSAPFSGHFPILARANLYIYIYLSLRSTRYTTPESA